MAIYIYCGEDLFRLEEALHLLIHKHGIDRDHIVKIDASNARKFKMEDVLYECDCFSLFDEDEKLVIVENPFFLNAGHSDEEKSKSSGKKKKKTTGKEESLQTLETYLKHPNPSTILLFYCHGFLADGRKKEYKLLEKYGAEIISCKKMKDDEFRNYMMKQLKKYGFTLDNDALQEFSDRVDTDSLLLHNALVKLDLYGEKHFSKEDICHLVPLNGEIDIFALTSAFTAGDLAGCMDALNELLEANYDYTVMISMLSKRLRMIYNMRSLSERGCSNDEIATRMHVKSGYVYYVLKDSRGMSSDKILSYINDLADMDQGIKQGRYIASDVFDQFLIRNGKKQYVYATSV